MNVNANFSVDGGKTSGSSFLVSTWSFCYKRTDSCFTSVCSTLHFFFFAQVHDNYMALITWILQARVNIFLTSHNILCTILRHTEVWLVTPLMARLKCDPATPSPPSFHILKGCTHRTTVFSISILNKSKYNTITVYASLFSPSKLYMYHTTCAVKDTLATTIEIFTCNVHLYLIYVQ